MFNYITPVMFTDSDGDFPVLILIGIVIVTAIAVHGAVKAYKTAKSLGLKGWELTGYTASGIILGDYLPVKNKWEDISKNIDPGLINGIINFDFTSNNNRYYSIYTASLYSKYLKNNIYYNKNSRTQLGAYIELQGHYLGYLLGNSHGNPAFLGDPDWSGDWTAALAEFIAGIFYGTTEIPSAS